MANGSEIWKDVPELDGWQASNFGRIRTCWSRWSKPGFKRKLEEWLVVPQRTTKSGYKRIYITSVEGRKSYFVHRLVLQSFVGPRPNGSDTRHLDDDKTNNRLDNLAWGTRSENMIDGFANGKYPSGSRHYNSKLTDENVCEIFRLRKMGWVQRRIADKFGVGSDQICRILSGKRWRWLEREVCHR